jgi:hypothetical protein
MKCLGGRLSDSGSRSGHICDGANPTRVIDRENGTNATGLGNPAAQQAAHANKQQPPLQVRSDAGSVRACRHWACCSDAGVAGRSDARDAA